MSISRRLGRGAWIAAQRGTGLLLPAEYSEERAEDFLFSSYECCFDFAALVGRKSDERLYYDDYHGFQGIRVGMIKGNFLNDLFDEYAENHGFSYEHRIL